MSAQEEVERLLDRIGTVDAHTRAICTLHPDALARAAALDAEAAPTGPRGPLHGRAVLVKDNVDTHDLPTTAGSLALADAPAPTRDAAARAPGCARPAWCCSARPTSRSGRTSATRPPPRGWSGYGGLTRNPYALNRSAGGSSSGSGAAVGAGLASFAIGTETDGSITSPAAFNGCVGLKPTVGGCPPRGWCRSRTRRTRRARWPPPSATPPRCWACWPADGVDYAAHAVAGRLAGKRIGVPRRSYWGYSPHADAAAERAVALLAAEGATIVDATDLPALTDEVGAAELTVLLAELRAGLRGLPRHPRRRRAALARGGRPVQPRRTPTSSSRTSGSRCSSRRWPGRPSTTVSTPRRAPAAWRSRARTASTGCCAEHDLDALVTPSYAPASPIDLVNPESFPGSCTSATAMAGYPLLTVPTELAAGLPVAVSFWGAAGSEATLVEIAHGYEQARDRTTGPLPPPTFADVRLGHDQPTTVSTRRST